MNVYTLLFVKNLWSFRNELLAVLLSFTIMLAMPVIGVIVLTQTGLNIVSDTLATANPLTRTIQILNPADGSLYKEIDAEIVWPVTGVISLEFAQSSMYQVFHTGLDIANPYGMIGDPISPFMDGVVTYEGEKSWGYGKYVIIDHGDNITSVYAHLQRINVHTGQEVTQGDIIGLMGSTGWSTGPHLHFETRVFGIPVNPRVFLGEMPATSVPSQE